MRGELQHFCRQCRTAAQQPQIRNEQNFPGDASRRKEAEIAPCLLKWLRLLSGEMDRMDLILGILTPRPLFREVILVGDLDHQVVHMPGVGVH
jgi:hypothetical protein